MKNQKSGYSDGFTSDEKFRDTEIALKILRVKNQPQKLAEVRKLSLRK